MRSALARSCDALPEAVQPVELAQLDVSLPAQVCGVRLDPREAAWLRAIGIFEGQQVTVLRRALLGGPLHVRTGSGAEFALSRELARAIDAVR